MATEGRNPNAPRDETMKESLPPEGLRTVSSQEEGLHIDTLEDCNLDFAFLHKFYFFFFHTGNS